MARSTDLFQTLQQISEGSKPEPAILAPGALFSVVSLEILKFLERQKACLYISISRKT